MITFPAKIGGKQVVASGSLLSYEGQYVEINPFNDEYVVEIRIVFKDKASTTEIASGGENRSIVTMYNNFSTLGFAIGEYLPFVMLDDDKRCFISIAARAIGPEKNYALLVNFTVLRED